MYFGREHGKKKRDSTWKHSGCESANQQKQEENFGLSRHLKYAKKEVHHIQKKTFAKNLKIATIDTKAFKNRLSCMPLKMVWLTTGEQE